jgi:hypothetical protein
MLIPCASTRINLKIVTLARIDRGGSSVQMPDFIELRRDAVELLSPHQRERRSAVQIVTRYGVEVPVDCSLLHMDTCGELETLRRARRLTVRASRVAGLQGEAAIRTGVVNEWLEGVDLVQRRPAVLTCASEPMPLPVGTLDAIHLAVAEIVPDPPISSGRRLTPP